MKSVFFSAIVSMVFLTTSVCSEILQGIRYMDTLGDVKQRLPNANYQSKKPAWLKPSEAFYEITGVGLSGTLMIAFDDSRPAFIKTLKQNEHNPNYEHADMFKRLSSEPDNEALTVNWVRWMPDKSIPIERYKSRYGTPVCSFNDAMEPICKWLSIALEAQMSEGHKSVLFVTTDFTKTEKRTSYQNRFNLTPNELK